MCAFLHYSIRYILCEQIKKEVKFLKKIMTLLIATVISVMTVLPCSAVDTTMAVTTALATTSATKEVYGQ